MATPNVGGVNLDNYSRTIIPATLTLTHDIQYKGIIHDNQGNVLADFSAGISLIAILNTLTGPQGLEFADVSAQELLHLKYPLVFP